MKSIFLSHRQLFENALQVFRTVGTMAQASDLVLATMPDDGFTLSENCVNYFLSGEDCVDRFGRDHKYSICAVRPALLLEPGDEKLLRHQREIGDVVTVELGSFPYAILDTSMREMAEKQYEEGSLKKTGLSYTLAGEKRDVYRLGAKQIVRIPVTEKIVSGYVQLSDGSVANSAEEIFLEVRPIRWYYDEINKLLICGRALFAGLSREAANEYLGKAFIEELLAEDEGPGPHGGQVEAHMQVGRARTALHVEYLHVVVGVILEDVLAVLVLGEDLRQLGVDLSVAETSCLVILLEYLIQRRSRARVFDHACPEIHRTGQSIMDAAQVQHQFTVHIQPEVVIA